MEAGVEFRICQAISSRSISDYPLCGFVDRSLSVTITRGTDRKPLSRHLKKRIAALPSGRFRTSMSSTMT